MTSTTRTTRTASTTPSAPTIEVEGLTKVYGGLPAVDGLTFTVRPGAVTGFLGPNGAGKTTTIRMLLGLATPTAGRALIGGRSYRDHRLPATVVGSSLEPGFHPGRSGIDHLRSFAAPSGVGLARCRELIALVGLEGAEHRRVGGYSMGMRQRLGLATALLGDPPVLVLDEPANGLDPQGIVWLRHLLRRFAAEGRTVLVSSHALREVQHTVDDVVVVARGRLVHASSLAALADRAAVATYVASPDDAALGRLAAQHGWRVEPQGSGLLVQDVAAALVGDAAFAAGVPLHRLEPRDVDLEDVFLRLTSPTASPVGGR
ncbi:ABC-2 type transport system ATP-binding protein [Nocardioides zeae]|uniref:ABC-2 type transport system ATP-binding protein n=1 Tax=Nocardioides zeae TaxID=1457234 RepID=A0ACC6IGX8_9ACTN|nr:ATP-binding cassette domain-containing protein [Nocardioides zeae]MDR6172987.1 ABC-2 type transport system ATP-binding protein [Nocardioides zeae]MDR6209981.1 ABC-2 type transport system ATP-binding protein [Nocardioides zeae]